MKKLSEAQEFALGVARRDGWVSPGDGLYERTLESLVWQGLLELATNPATGLIEYRPVAQTIVEEESELD